MREKKFKKKVISLFLAFVIIVSGIIIPGQTSSAATATSSKIKIYNFIKLLVPATGLEIDTTVTSPYLKAALAAGIVKEGDFEDYKEYLTREDAAVLINRADELLRGDKVDSDLLEVVSEKRISDIKKIPAGKREAVAKVYAKGIITGKSNGLYMQNRSFSGSTYLTAADAKIIISRLKSTKNRSKLSPDGQLIRTTNLPKNAKSFSYILESFPNSFYEKKFLYQRMEYSFKPVELIHYASPAKFKNIDLHGKKMEKVLENYQDTWMERVETNLNSRLNVDYRTVDNKWITALRSTYTQFGVTKLDKEITDDIKTYVKSVKKNKIVITSKVVSVEPSSLYSATGYYVRVYVKFKISYAGTKLTADDLIFGDTMYMPKLKKGEWHEGVYDIKLGTINGLSDGKDYYISNDSLEDYTD